MGAIINKNIQQHCNTSWSETLVVPNLPKYRTTRHKEVILNFKEGAQFLPGIMINLETKVSRFDNKIIP